MGMIHIIINDAPLNMIRDIARRLAMSLAISGIQVRSAHDNSEMEKLLDQIRNNELDFNFKLLEVRADRNYPKPKRERNKHQLHPQAKNPRAKR